jgi:hypothetical protein
MTRSQSLRLLNATATGDRLIFEEPQDDLRRLEWFVRSIAWRFQQSAAKQATAPWSEHMAKCLHFGWDGRKACAKFDEMERNEIAVFAGEYRAECGTEYPHTAAGVSIQRYGDLGPSKHPPKRYGNAVLRHCGRRRR